MQCDKKKCKKCGMWWRITSTDEQGRLQEDTMCGHLAMYLKMDQLLRAINGVRTDTQDGRNQVITTMRKAIER